MSTLQMAKMSDGNYVYAIDLVNNGQIKNMKKTNYYCPNCMAPVFLKVGNDVRPHFAHFHSKQHVLDQTNESEIHFSQKHKLVKLLADAHIQSQPEFLIESKKRRGDIYLKNQTLVTQPLTIELQYSLISSSAVFARERDYLEDHIHVLWLLGYKSNYQRIYEWTGEKRLNNYLTAVVPYLRLNDQLGYYIPFWHEDRERVSLLVINLYGRPQKQVLLSIVRYISHFNLEVVNEGISAGDEFTKHHWQIIQRKGPPHFQHWVTQKRLNPTKLEQVLLSFLYEKQHYLQYLPKKIFTYPEKAIFSKVADWHILAIYYVLGKTGETNQLQVAKRLLSELIRQGILIQHPFFTNEIQLIWLQGLLRHYEGI